jgi:hypothetical protein
MLRLEVRHGNEKFKIIKVIRLKLKIIVWWFSRALNTILKPKLQNKWRMQ